MKIVIDSEDIPKLFPLFQKGVCVKIRIGCSIKTLLCDILEIPQDYVHDRISTIFLDGKPVDHLESAFVRKNSILSLSAAMPGLVGAVMRRDGVLASFRDGISYRTNREQIESREEFITIKLFNMLISELSERFLRKGFWTKASDIREFLPNQCPMGSDEDMIFVCIE